MAARLLDPPHPAVDWTRTRSGAGPTEVLVRCPLCGRERWMPAKTVRYRIKQDAFAGRCQDCNEPPVAAIVRLAHPALDDGLVRGSDGRLRFQITCPACGKQRLGELGAVRKAIRLGTFTGLCRPDNIAAVRARKRTRAAQTPR